jgi:hypothetical protein
MNKSLIGEPASAIYEFRRRLFAGNSSADNLGRVFTDAEVIRTARHWVEIQEAVVEYVPAEQLRTILYEDMLADQSAILSASFRDLGVDADDRIVSACMKESSFRRMSGGRNPGEENLTGHIRKGVRGDWRKYFTRHDAELFHDTAGRALIHWGYETSDAWIEGMPKQLHK